MVIQFPPPPPQKNTTRANQSYRTGLPGREAEDLSEGPGVPGPEALGTGPSPVPPGLGDGLLVFSLAYARHLAAGRGLP